MSIKSTLGRFSLPLSFFKKENADKVVGAAKRCFNSSEGEIVLKHLITEFDLDGNTGVLSMEDANYRNGQKDVIRYILGLSNDT